MKKPAQNIFQILILLVFIFSLTKFVYNEDKLNQCNRIVIATVYKISGSPKTGITLTYKYNFREQKHEGNMLINAEDFFTQASKKRFFAKVSCITPSISVLLLDANVPENIYESPSEGWYSLDSLHH